MMKRDGGRGLSRRQVLKLGATAAAGAAMGIREHAARAQAFNWQRFRGTELFLILTRHPGGRDGHPHPEFESLSGMKVTYEMLPRSRAGRSSRGADGGNGGVDAFHTALHVEKRRFWKSGWYQPLNRFLEDKSLTAPELTGRLRPAAKAAVTEPDNTISAIPRWSTSLRCSTGRTFFSRKVEGPQTLRRWRSMPRS